MPKGIIYSMIGGSVTSMIVYLYSVEKLNLPEANIRTAVDHGRELLFDFLRQRWVASTPEEWVRQNLMHYLVFHLNYPRGRIGVEIGVRIQGKMLRADAVVYSKKGAPVAVVECKAPGVPLNTDVFRQASIYNLQLKAPYLIISNGMEHFCALVEFDSGAYNFLDSFPLADDLI